MGYPPRGSPHPVFAKDGSKVANRFKEVLLTDHGPYLELQRDDIIWERFTELRRDNPQRFYNLFKLKTPNLNHSLNIYEQLKPVNQQKNPPKGKWSAKNEREGGYADYRVGMYYMPIDNLANFNKR